MVQLLTFTCNFSKVRASFPASPIRTSHNHLWVHRPLNMRADFPLVFNSRAAKAEIAFESKSLGGDLVTSYSRYRRNHWRFNQIDIYAAIGRPDDACRSISDCCCHGSLFDSSGRSKQHLCCCAARITSWRFYPPIGPTPQPQHRDGQPILCGQWRCERRLLHEPTTLQPNY